ncbi:hypothetical protein [Nitratidesulfovibrio sp. 1201_IL3209]|uniref:hypothetical protein n=1 Tax=Nitratidesulfovibrio sp. 1201_IL3209 TaxID=3084053 RepID=UPI002FD9EA40
MKRIITLCLAAMVAALLAISMGPAVSAAADRTPPSDEMTLIYGKDTVISGPEFHGSLMSMARALAENGCADPAMADRIFSVWSRDHKAHDTALLGTLELVYAPGAAALTIGDHQRMLLDLVAMLDEQEPLRAMVRQLAGQCITHTGNTFGN